MSYNIGFLFLFALLPLVVVDLGCYSDHSEQLKRESYEANQWPYLMEGFSPLDIHLASLSPSKSTSYKYFGDVLKDNGLSQKLVQDLIKLVIDNDMIFDGPSYHGLIHSARVANLAAASISLHELTKVERISIIVSAVLHDIDPDRAKGTPARVLATFKWMDENKQARAFFAQLKSETNITTDQIKTLIKFTDFDVNPEKMAEIEKIAKEMANKYFGQQQEFAITWGQRLASFDKAAMYVASFKFAVQAVVGLANEFRRSITLNEAKKGNYAAVTSPSDVVILSATPQFLAALLADKNLAWFPLEMQTNLRSVYESFNKIWAGRKYL